MTKQKEPRRGNRWSVITCIALSSSVTFAEESAKPEAVPDQTLEPIVVSALRVAREASTVTSAVTVLDPDIMVGEGILTLRDALNASPGVISTSAAGQTGAVGALLIRGTITADSLMVVDGVRMNGSGNQIGNLLATSRTRDVGALEVLRGPQGAIYGGESVGGVIWMETPRGMGKPSGSTTFEAGSFNSLSAHGTFQGQSGGVSYYLSGGYEETDNDGQNLHFHQGSSALRVEGELNPVWTIGGTFRSADSYYENGGASDDRFDAILGSAYAVGTISDRWTARFTAGYYEELYDSVSVAGNYYSDLRAVSFAMDHEFTLADDIRLLGGGFFHTDSYESQANYPNPPWPYFSRADEGGDRYGAYAVLEWDAFENFTSSAALRWEDYDSFGDEVTWRLGSIYHINETGTSLRGGVGTSFRSPTYLDLYYASSTGGIGNPNLDPQSSLGWEFGIDQKIGDHHTVQITGFRNIIDDAIASLAFPSPVNLPGKTTTDGLELGLRGDWLESTLNYRIAWTYLHESLNDQPRNAVTGSVDWKPVDKLQVGAGATHLSSHSWGGNDLNGYIVARLFGSYQITDSVKFHARVENVLNEGYELSSFFGTVVPGAGTGVYCGLTFDW
jgi:outer membrane cobalamin receptor